MIGGHDIVFPAVGDSATLDGCARIVQCHWPTIRFEDAITGDKYSNLKEIPLGKITELLVYPNEEAEASWDADSANSEENSMIYLIIRSKDVTIVVDNPDTNEMRSILDAIHEFIWQDICYCYARAA